MNRRLAVVFAISGGAGLVYEVAWARALGQSIGQSLQGLTAVLVVFLAGLGAGAAIGGRFAGRARSPLRTYAGLEFAIAGFGLLSPWLLGQAPWLMEMAGPSFPPGFPRALLRLAIAGTVLTLPTLAMGATLPYLVREARARGHRPERSIATLYGANTLGAAAGALIGSFVLLPLAGTRGSIIVAAGLNLVAGIAALLLRRPGTGADRTPRDTRSPEPSPTAGLGPPEPRFARRLALSVAVVSGGLGAILQVGWVRAITLTFGSSAYAVGLTLTAYILGLGTGPIVSGRWRWLQQLTATRRAAVTLWLVGLFSLLALPCLGLLPSVAAALSGRFPTRPALLFGSQFLIAAALIFPATMAQGASFPPLAILAGRRLDHRGAAVGAAFAASSWGSAIGFLVAGFLAVPRIGTRSTLVLAATAALLLCALLGWHGRGGAVAIRRPALLYTVLLIPAPLILLALPSWDRQQMSAGGFLYGPVYRSALGGDRVPEAIRRRGDLLFYREDGAGLVTVRRNPGGVLSLQINGKTEASSGGDMGTQLLTTHLPLLLHPEPRRVLLIGLASGVSLGAAERHAIEAVTAVEIVPAVVDASRLFDEHNRRALDDPRARVAIDDARSYLLTRPDRYDIIASQPSNPWVAGVPNLFTVDFYRLARRRLRPAGLFLQWVQAYRLEPRDLRGIVGSFLEIFPEATLWEESAGGGDYFLIGGDAPIVVDPVRLRAAPAEVWEDLRRAGIEGPADLLARFVSGPVGLRAFAGGAPLHTDDDLYLEWRAPLALFRDTLPAQIALLNRYRAPVGSLFAPGIETREPELLAELGQRLRQRAARLAIAASLKEADRLALSDPYLAAGIDRLRTGRFVDAITALSRATVEHPDSAAAHMLLGEAYRGAGLTGAAAVAFREALRHDADLAEAWNALGQCLLEAGHFDDAQQAFREAVRRDPQLTAARNNLGTSLVLSGDLEGAESSFRSALRADPESAAARANLGLVHRRRGDPEGAVREYRAALQLDPVNLDARYNLAAALQALGQTADAGVELEKILSIDPGDEASRQLLETVRGRPDPR